MCVLAVMSLLCCVQRTGQDCVFRGYSSSYSGGICGYARLHGGGQMVRRQMLTNHQRWRANPCPCLWFSSVRWKSVVLWKGLDRVIRFQPSDSDVERHSFTA